MSGRPSRKVSARARIFLSLLFVITLTIILTSAPRPSNARRQADSPDATQKRSKPAFVPGQALVRYRSESVAKRVAAAIIVSVNSQEVAIQMERFEGADVVPGLRLAHMAPEHTLDAIEALKKEPDVLYAEPNYLLYRDLTPNDPCFPLNSLSGCSSTSLYGLSKIGAPQAWNTTQGSSAVVVGVIDEGIDIGHQDLVDNVWTNPSPGSISGITGDLHGYDFAHNTGTIPAESHATHVAGTIGAVGNNSTGVVGVNWNVRLMSLKFINGVSGDTADAIRACNYAKQMRDLWISSGGTTGANVRVLSNSYGGGGSNQSFLDAINAAGQSGILFVAAAGNAPESPERNNDLVPHYPSGYIAPNVIAVASTDSADNLSGFSHYGATSVQIGAPGSSILSTTPNNTYSVFSGTSMATPHVAGAAALLLAANPNLTVQQLRSLLLFNGDSISALAGKTLTGRRLNVGNSFLALAENDVTPPGTATNFHINTQTGRSMNLGWTASGDDGAAGQASLYQISFTDGATGTVVPLGNLVPAASGTTQALDVKIPYRHTTGTLTLREFDNVGNEGTPATFPATISQVEGDPYITQVGSPTSLSTGGTALGLRADDGLKLSYALPFSFPFFGQNFSAVNISTNGNLFFSPPPTRANGEADDVPSSSLGLGQFKMISGLWDDLRTDGRAGDDVYVVADSTHIIFRWQGEIFGDGSDPANQPPVNFEIELRSDGTILTRYGSGNTNLFPVVGIGGGEPDAYVIPSHTSEQTPISLTNAQTVTFSPRALSINSTVQFSQSQFNTSESTGNATVTVTRTGDTSSQASVDYVTVDGSATQKGDYLFASGRLTFAPGEMSKSITVLIIDDAYEEGTEVFSVSLSNPIATTLGSTNIASVAIADNDTVPPTSNPLDNSDARFFVRQHYIDFLNREPDQSGLDFWSHQISDCTDQACIEIRRINVSAAFFLSIEFQQTGYLVERMYKVAYGDATGTSTFNGVHQLSVPIVRFNEFLVDSQQIGRGVVIGQPGADQLLESNKVAFAADFVNRTRFSTAYATSLTPSQFVDALFAHAGVIPSASDRTAAINEFGGTATNTANTAARGRALRRIAENNLLDNAEKNRAFVLMQYFGYLRRDPNSGQDTDYTGYDFWLTKLLQFNGNFVNAEMVKAFIVSAEYRQRFGPG